MDTPHQQPAWHSRIWRKHLTVNAVVVCAAILGFGFAEMSVAYKVTLDGIALVQQARAREVAQVLESAITNVERHVEAVTSLPWTTGSWLTLETRREEYARLLRLVPAVESVAFVDADGSERLSVSRRSADVFVPAQPATKPRAGARSAAPPAFVPARPATKPVAGAQSPEPPDPFSILKGGSRDDPVILPAASQASEPAKPRLDQPRPAVTRTYGFVDYLDDYDPRITLSIVFPEAAELGKTVVTIALRALTREVSAALSVVGAEAYAVDARGVVIIHPDASVVLEKRGAALPIGDAPAPSGGVSHARVAGLRGNEVLRSTEAMTKLGWRVIVEQPVEAAMVPVYATLWRAAAFMVAGLTLAFAASLYLSSRLTRPIRELHRASEAIGAGSLTARVDVRTGDELEALGGRFNEMADSLNASYAQLESRVAEKTHELELANRHKSDFLARMSHELRTPLNVILGSARLLLNPRSKPLHEDQREIVNDVLGSGLDLLKDINDLLDLSKIEAGRLELHAAEFDLGELVQTALLGVRDRAEQGAVAVEVDLAPDLPTWSADKEHLKKILSNLLVNAVKFTDPGGTVRVRARLAGTDDLCFDVSDTGIGIAEADLARIFEPYPNVQDVGRRNAEGIGLGLPLAKQLVELHGGRISVASRLGEGSTFTFNIPWIEPT